jgi:hydroxyethylthiazole kinase
VNVQIDPQGVWFDIQTIRQNSPLIHNITNFVVMEQSANALLALGASPVMAHALEEVQEMAALSCCLVLNIGTLSPSWIEAMILAAQMANSKGLPIVLDPVGIGATRYRTQEAYRILSQNKVTVIRGNASEIAFLSDNTGSIKGVDSLLEAVNCLGQATSLALKYQCIVWMSGKTDVVTDGQTVAHIHNGHPLMGKVTGMGCTATAITGTFLAVNPNVLQATIHAAILMGVTGQMTAQKATGPGSFKLQFLDVLYTLSLAQIKEHACVEIL